MTLVRPATVHDVPAILPMTAKICAMHEQADPDKYGYLPDIVERYAYWLPKRVADPRSVLLVAEVEGKVGGYIIGTVEDDIPIYRVQKFGFIHDLWVEEAHRGLGLGKQLTLRAIERFREIGVEQIRLDTLRTNDAARRVFVACGFRASTIEMLMTLR